MRRVLMLTAIMAAFCLGAISFVGGNRVDAMPNFSRKLGVPCSTCHTTIPKLNETGYKFRAAGFRMPETIGKDQEKPFELGDYVAGRIQARYDASRTKTGPAKTTKNSLTFHEVTLYPMTGAWGKYFSSLIEASILPEEPVELENAFVRADFGKAKHFYETRVGIFHPFEGFGASDRPVSISRPFFQTTAATFNQSTFFTPWNFDEAGAEVGIDHHRTSLRATVFNGLLLKDADGTLKAFPAQGGPLSKTAVSPAHNSPDVQLFANQIIHQDGGALSAYYYHGSLGLPIAGTNDFFRNDFDRAAFYASYPVVKQLHLLGGFQHGRDHLATGGTFNSRGAFVEGDVPINEYATAGLRYDWFDPATNKARNQLTGITAFLNVPLQNGFQFIAEYQHKDTKRGLLPEKKDDAFQVRFVFIK
jgi:hypothetical protein